MKILKIFAMTSATLLLINFLSACSVGNNQSQVRFQDTRIKLDPFKQNRKLGKGINLGNALDAPYEGDANWGKAIDVKDLKRIADAGFNTVRIPIRWSNKTTQISLQYRSDIF